MKWIFWNFLIVLWSQAWTEKLSTLLYVISFVFKLCIYTFSPCLQVLCVRMCMFYSAMILAGWPISSEAARLRCGSDLLSDLIFVCGDRGIYLGKSIFMFPTMTPKKLPMKTYNFLVYKWKLEAIEWLGNHQQPWNSSHHMENGKQVNTKTFRYKPIILCYWTHGARTH